MTSTGPSRLPASKPAVGGLKYRARFLGQFITRPHVIGAVAPSSDALARRMIRDLNLSSASAVLEYGPGTGAFTARIHSSIGPNTRFVAIERNAALAAALRERFPSLQVYERSVEDVEAICREAGIDKVDAIVSGLPWASFPEGLQRRALEATRKVLRPGGKIVTFGYHIGRLTTAGKRFYRILPEYFPDFRFSGSVWWNLPPAFVVTCERSA